MSSTQGRQQQRASLTLQVSNILQVALLKSTLKLLNQLCKCSGSSDTALRAVTAVLFSVMFVIYELQLLEGQNGQDLQRRC
jgi:hypothetical protein